MRSKSFVALLVFCLSASLMTALDVKPWFNQPWEFEGAASYTRSQYSSVNRSLFKSSSIGQLLAFNLSVSPTPIYQDEIEVEFARTLRIPWGLRSIALAHRILWLDDIIGDPVSLVTGLSFRYATSRLLRALGTPYQSNYNFELNQSIGKEWSQGPFFTHRIFGVIGLGSATVGAPYLLSLVKWEMNHRDQRRVHLGFYTNWGFGREHFVNPRHFHGYAHINHRNLDGVAGYEELLGIWGACSLDIGYRLWAYAFPENYFFVRARYRLPFSFF